MGDYNKHDKHTRDTKELVDTSYDINNDEIFKKYANKSLPLNTKKTRAGLSVYTGAWTVKQQKHLIRRLMFGVKRSDVAAIAGLTPSQAVDTLLNNPIPNPAPPVNYYENIYADVTNIGYGQPWVNAAYGDGTQNYYRRLSLKSWWMKNIVTQNMSIHEKMVLFLSNHYPVEFSVASDARFLYKYMNLLRTHALGNLKTFITELSKDGSMLRYLNGHFNVKNSPDENYAREVQELFTVGKGTVQFSELDVQEAAKVLTGWRYDALSLTTSFDPTRHETMNKQFSGYYNSTIINGQTGVAGANEINDLMDMLFSKDQDVAKYFARKVYRFFIYYDIDTNIETTIINGLAQTLINNNWEIKPMLAQLFKSDHFFEPNTMDCIIRTPIDFYAGSFRSMEASVDPAIGIEDEYKSYYRIVSNAALAGQNIGDPPSVSGWPAYYQTPHYHQMWINSDTLPKRMKATDTLLNTNGYYVSANARLKHDVLVYAQSLSNPSDPDVVVNEAVEYLLGVDLSQSLKDYYKSILLGGQTSNIYWTNAWNDYINAPTNTTFAGTVRTRLNTMLTEMLRMAEHHLS